MFNRRNVARHTERVLQGGYLGHSEPFEDETLTELPHFALEGGDPPPAPSPMAAALTDLTWVCVWGGGGGGREGEERISW